MAIITKRTIMSLYSSDDDPYSHQVRIVLAEKGVNVDIISVKNSETSGNSDTYEDLIKINPYATVPTLIDRELILYEARIIMEYLDERFPHPPMLPVYPIARAESRKMIFRIEKDWYQLMDKIYTDSDIEQAQTDLTTSLCTLEPVFANKPFFLSDEFSMLDCVLAPLLWRLPKLGITLPESETKSLSAYMQRVFERSSFQSSLSETEKQLRAA